MVAPVPGSEKEAAARQLEDRLDSWKAIAAYVKRDVTTVQRWEKREGMPVHRHLHDKRGSVYAFRAELDAWLKDRRLQPPSELPQRRPWWVGVAAIVVLIAAVGAWIWLRPEPPASDLLEHARLTLLTDFEGTEQAAAISRDGRFVAFLSDRDGQMDVWVTQAGTGEFHNLTQGKAPELYNPDVRSLGFTPDGALVTLWTRTRDPSTGNAAVNTWAVPTIGGALRPYWSRAVEVDWSPDGRSAVFHTTDPGDPTFVSAADQRDARQVSVGARGVHNHFQLWSPDGEFIYYTHGVPPDEMDLWRMKPDGSGAERLTFHNSRVIFPGFVDRRTLLYLATTEEGAGPWLYALDVQRRVSRRISFGVEQYTSLATSADGRGLAVTVERPRASLWRVAITDGISDESGASRIELPTVGGLSPRAGPDYLVYVVPKGTGYGIWKLADGTATELRSALEARVVGGVAISPDGTQIAFAEESREGTKLYVMTSEGAGARRVAESLEVRGAPAWLPDGSSLTVSAMSGKERRLYRVPTDGAPPVALLDGRYAMNPLWAPDGKWLIYSDAAIGTTFEVKAVTADGKPYPLPPITLPRASRRISFVPGRHALVVLQGEMQHVNFWYVDLETGKQRPLTQFGREFVISDFDVTPDGTIVFDRLRNNSDIAQIELSIR